MHESPKGRLGLRCLLSVTAASLALTASAAVSAKDVGFAAAKSALASPMAVRERTMTANTLRQIMGVPAAGGRVTANRGGGSVCGNGLPGSGEQCDDGNTSDGDGCSSSCQLETCDATGLSVIEHLVAAKSGDGDITFWWQTDPDADEHHVNAVTTKRALADPRRGSGARAVCDGLGAAASCTELMALSDASDVYYQALASCSSGLEGPY